MSFCPWTQGWQDKFAQKMIDLPSIECFHHFFLFSPLPENFSTIDKKISATEIRKFQQTKYINNTMLLCA
jgi:hypothetical protein